MAETQTRNHIPKNVTLDPRVVDVVNARRRETLEPFSTALCALVLLGAKQAQQVQG